MNSEETSKKIGQSPKIVAANSGAGNSPISEATKDLDYMQYLLKVTREVPTEKFFLVPHETYQRLVFFAISQEIILCGTYRELQSSSKGLCFRATAIIPSVTVGSIKLVTTIGEMYE